MLTYDRRVLRCDVPQWKSDIVALYAAAERRAGNATVRTVESRGLGAGAGGSGDGDGAEGIVS